MPDLSSQLREYFDATASPLEVDTVVGDDAWVDSTKRTRLRGSVIPAWAYALGALALILVVALGVNLLLAGDQNQVVEPTPTITPDFFTEIPLGEFVELPDWPLSERTAPPMVWTGTELIVWGDGSDGQSGAGDGAAIDLAKGTWRVIAEAPISPRTAHAAAWTGTEMIVWGGRVSNSFYYDGAVYNPVTDTWRIMPPPPAGFAGKDPSMVWTGTEAVILSEGAAAYDPIRDSWRTLAAPPFGVHALPAWWTGDSIVVADVGDPEYDQMARYDLVADGWTMVDVGSSGAVVGVPGSDGTVSTFVNLPSETGAPVRLMDSTGSPIGELPAFPGDPGVFGDQIGAFGLWVGDEAVFEIWEVGAGPHEPEQIWALNPSAQTWRRLDVDTAFPRVDYSAVVAGDLLLMWNRPGDVFRGPPGERVCCVAPPGKGGSAYRVGIASSD